MKDYECPLGQSCGGTGWLWAGPSNATILELGDKYVPRNEYVPCACNPTAIGNPYLLLVYYKSKSGWLARLPRREKWCYRCAICHDVIVGSAERKPGIPICAAT